MAEIQENNSGKGKEGQTEKDDHPGRFYPDGGYEHVAHYVLYALYLVEQASDDGNKHAE